MQVHQRERHANVWQKPVGNDCMGRAECAVDTGFMRTAHQMIDRMKNIQNQRKEMDHRRLDRDTARAAMANAPVERSAQMVDAYNHAKDLFEGVRWVWRAVRALQLNSPHVLTADAKNRLEASLTDLMNKEGEVIQALTALVEAQRTMYVPCQCPVVVLQYAKSSP